MRVRRVKGFLTLYSAFAYTIYTAIVLVGNRQQRQRLHWLGLVGAPFLVWLLRWILQKWYSWWSANNDEQIEALETRRKEMIEELKQNTNFYSTQALISRFDKDQAESRQEVEEELKRKESLDALKAQPPQEEFLSESQVPMASPYPTMPMVPYQPKWYDRILDLVAGEDEYSPKLRYALICQQCTAHNGLAQPGEVPEDVVYICPHCGFKNGKIPHQKHQEQQQREKKNAPEFDNPEETPEATTENEEQPQAQPQDHSAQPQLIES
ncbi:hypothetical protein TRICI_004475 [Trichomonascus ciferrii]|uniref:Endoplasmic reticulum junction formation protein lunapark n=1 Tax=Trichomonascus ciferrii TaxID=44093 RepID=A0A642V293_9ASCO|nr:hypothetical protein TRICI_004475 [Trichomonascus ciferrii]